MNRERLIHLAEKAGLLDHYKLSSPREYFLCGYADEFLNSNEWKESV